MVVPHKILRAPSERHATHSPHPHVCARPPIKRFSDAVPRRAGEAEAAAIFGDVSRSFAPDAAPFRECVRAPLATAEKSITGRKTVCVRHPKHAEIVRTARRIESESESVVVELFWTRGRKGCSVLWTRYPEFGGWMGSTFSVLFSYE